jgi:hypothetical protein
MKSQKTQVNCSISDIGHLVLKAYKAEFYVCTINWRENEKKNQFYITVCNIRNRETAESLTY